MIVQLYLLQTTRTTIQLGLGIFILTTRLHHVQQYNYCPKYNTHSMIYSITSKWNKKEAISITKKKWKTDDNQKKTFLNIYFLIAFDI